MKKLILKMLALAGLSAIAVFGGIHMPGLSQMSEVMAASPESNFRYKVMTDSRNYEDCACIREYLGDETDIVIPEELGGYPVREVSLFSGNSEDVGNYDQVLSVTFPKNMRVLDSNACHGFANLTSVTLQDGVEYIGGYAFRGCKKLEELTIPATVTLIQEVAIPVPISDQAIQYNVQTGSYADTFLTNCGANVVRTGTKVAVTGLTIDGSQSTSREFPYTDSSENRNFQLEAVLTPSDASYRRIEWTVSDSDVVGFDAEDGLNNYGSNAYFYIKKGGSAQITATAEDGYQAVCSVHATVPISCQEISLSQDSYEYDGTEKQPQVTVDGLTEGSDYEVEYADNVEVGTGTVTIRGLGDNTGSVTKEFTITPKQESGSKDESKEESKGDTSGNHSNTGAQGTSVKVSGIALSGISHKIAAGKKIQLTASVSPSNATNKAVTWSSSNTKVATVDANGLVTVKKKTGGKSVTITATAADGSGATASYKIKSMKGVVKKITISGKKSVKAGKSLKLKAKVKASKGANKKVIWTSSNTQYATVNSKGKVKTYKAGKGKKVKITAMATDGSGKKKTKTIKIK